MDTEQGLCVGVDFDGTCVTHAFPKIGMEVGAVPVLKRLVEQGHRLILFTMRSNGDGRTGTSVEFPEVVNGNHLDDAVEWFKSKGIELYGINTNPTQHSWTSSPKAYCQLYIDDAGIGCPLKLQPEMSDRPFVDWFRVEAILEREGILKAETVAETIREMNEEYLDSADDLPQVNPEQTNQ